MTLTEYFTLQEKWLRERRHIKTVNETRVAVEAFCEWIGSDPDIDSISQKLVDEFEADKTHRRRQLVSNLLGLLRLYDPKAFPRRNKTMFANAMQQRATVLLAVPKRAGRALTLTEFAALYVSQRTLSAGYAAILVRRAQNYEEFHSTTDVKQLFTEDALNTFLVALEGTGSPWTVNKWRQDLLTLWTAAADDDLCDYPRRRRIRKLKRDAPVVQCYTRNDVRSLVAAADQLSGCYDNGIARRHYWVAVIRFGYETGLRRGDCWRFERNCLQPDGTFRIVQHKTRKPIRRAIRPATVAAIDKIDSSTPLAWPLVNEWSFGFQFRRIAVAAGMEGGTFRWLRRAAGSLVEVDHPGAGHRAIGNTPQVFDTHYNADLAGEVFLPPAI